MSSPSWLEKHSNTSLQRLLPRLETRFSERVDDGAWQAYVQRIRVHFPRLFKLLHSLYGHYYDFQAMINHGGKEWEAYNRMVRDNLLKAQDRDGSWPKPGSKIQSESTTYRSALCTLMLESYYRFLPSTGKH